LIVERGGLFIFPLWGTREEKHVGILKELAQLLLEAADMGDPDMVLAAAETLQELDIQSS
jgi:hypothetical protein